MKCNARVTGTKEGDSSRKYLAGHHLGVIVLEEGEYLVGGGTELALGHVLEVGDLNDGVDAARAELERAHAALHDLDAPAEEPGEAVAVAEDAVVHVPVLEDAVGVVADGVAFAVPAVHVRHDALEVLEPEVLAEHGVGAELGAPGGAAEHHGVRVADAEVPGAEELEEHDVGALVGRGVGVAGRVVERHAPDGDLVRVGGEQRPEVGQRAEVGGRQRSGHVRVLLEGGRPEERGGVDEGTHQAALGSS